jgi:hypothetical protein
MEGMERMEGMEGAGFVAREDLNFMIFMAWLERDEELSYPAIF